MFLSDVSIRRPVFATMMMLTLVVLGVVAYGRLAVDEYPDVTYPVVAISVSYPGASPETVALEVSRPIEEAVNTTQGIREVSSTSQQGSSRIRVLFNLGVDIMTAQQDVQAKVARIRRSLPPTIEDPTINRFDPNERPIMSIAVQSPERPLRELTDMVQQTVLTRLQAVPGVGDVNMSGGSTRVIRVQLDPQAMRAYGVSPQQVSAALQRENQDVPAGRIDRGAVERLVRITGRIVDPLAFADVVVATRNGVPVRVGDIGKVVDGEADRRSHSEIAGNAAVNVDILKISGANTVEVSDSVSAAIADLERRLPGDVQLNVVRDDSRRIREALADVELTIVLGAILTIAIIYLFLNSWRSTVITGLALPISIISSFFIMWVSGFTLNTMTLMALSLAIGLLIDDAIVVRENIVRHMEMGKDHYRAAMEGTSEIGLAVFSTTLAVVAVFIPVAFMGGMIGKIFFQFGVTVAFAVLVSLFVSFTLDPMLSSVWYDPDVEEKNAHAVARTSRNPVRRFSQWFNDGFERVAGRYPGWLHWSLNHRWTILGIAALNVAVAFIILPRLPFTWMPDTDVGEFNVGFRTAPGSTLDYTVDRGRAVVALVRKAPEVEFTYLSIGGGFQGTPTGGQVFVKLKPRNQRARSMSEIQTRMRMQLRQITGARASVQGTRSIFGGYRSPIQVFVQGPEESRLKLAAGQVLAVMSTVPGIAEPQSSDEGQIPQLDVNVDRQMAWAAGVGVGAIGSTLQPLFTGQRATRWEDPNGYQHDVLVVYPDSLRSTPEDVANIPVPSTNFDPRTGQAAMIPLRQVAEIRAGVGPQQIERRMLERQVSINANVLPGAAVGDVADRVRLAIDSIGLPQGYHTVFGGDAENLKETTGYVSEALVLAVVFIYLILASLFGSFLQPLAIMLALPLSLIGVALALLLTKGSMNVMTMIGIIMLMGLVTKNGILLVDFTNQERERGIPRHRALLDAGRIRLRPIIMTTVAMIFGMLPLVFAIGEGAEQRAPMARAVVGGLITSTLLTLFVVPVVYTFLDDAGAWVAARLRAHPPVAAKPELVAGD